MSLKRTVFVLTSNAKKLPQIKRSFDRFGIDVVQAAPESDISKLLRSGTPAHVKTGARTKVVAVLKEQTTLSDFYTGKPAPLLDLLRVQESSTLTVHMLHDGKAAPAAPAAEAKPISTVTSSTSVSGDVVTHVYKDTQEGHIDTSARQGRTDESVFGWDDIFYPKHMLNMSMQDLAKRGFKYTSRDMVISQFLHDHVYYKQKVDLNFNPQKSERSVDFGTSVLEFCQKNKYLNNEWAVKYRVPNVYKAVVNAGVFFRSAKNRREKTYWLPGLNAGLPFTPKKDEIHEITYMYHDFGHFLIPDLIFTGTDSTLHRQVYIAYRMISEAVTMTLADMVMIDALQKGGVAYDFTKRKIFPMLDDMGINMKRQVESGSRTGFADEVSKLMRANVCYALRGDDKLYRGMLREQGRNDTNLEAFKGKYMPFFVEDLRWTVRNYDNFSGRKEEFARWWGSVESLREATDLSLETIDDCIRGIGLDPKKPAESERKLQEQVKLGGRDVIDLVFERVFQQRIRPVIAQEDVKLDPPHIALQRSFAKYMIGQMAIFSRYHFEPSSAAYQKKIADFLVKNRGAYTLDKVNACRGFYEQYLERLRGWRLLSSDDELTYREVFPLFEPFYVYYDHDLSAYQSLADLSDSVFKPGAAKKKAS